MVIGRSSKPPSERARPLILEPKKTGESPASSDVNASGSRAGDCVSSAIEPQTNLVPSSAHIDKRDVIRRDIALNAIVLLPVGRDTGGFLNVAVITDADLALIPARNFLESLFVLDNE